MLRKVLPLFLLLATPGFAQVQELSSHEVVRMALNHNFAMRKQNVEKAKLSETYREVLGRALPQMNLETTVSNFLDSPTMMGMPINKEYNTSYGFTISQAIYTFGAVSNALDVAEAAIKLQDISKLAVEREIAFAARMSYLAVLMAAKQVTIAEQSLSISKDNLRTLERQFALGRPPQADILRINTDIARKGPEVEIAKSNLRVAETRLKYLIGMEPSRSIKLTESLEHNGHIDISNVSKDAIADHPKLQALKSSIDLQAGMAKVQKSATLPLIGAFYSWNAAHQDDSKIYEKDAFSKTSVLGIKFTWSLWDGGSSHAGYRKALRDKELAELDLAESEDNLLVELQTISDEIPALKENLKGTRNALNLAERSLKMSRQRFSAGKTSVLELNDTETVLTQLRLAESLAVFKLKEAEVKLARLLTTDQQVKGSK